MVEAAALADERDGPTRPNVLFVLVDCLRGDHAFGPGRRAVTPNLDALAERASVFTKAFATASTTTISAASILTGTYPYVHGVRMLAGQRLPGKIPTLAEAFRASGYHTWAETTGPLVEATGLNRGFDSYRNRGHTEWLDTQFGETLRHRLQGGLATPWFGFLHLWEIHHPRRVTPAFQDPRYGDTQYARAVSSLDQQLGLLFDALPDDTVVIFTADHGEFVASSASAQALTRMKGPAAWMKRTMPRVKKLRRPLMRAIFRVLDRAGRREGDFYRAWLGHGFNVYDPLTHVPLFLAGLHGVRPGERRGDVVSHVDLYPTLAAALELNADITMVSGMDLVASPYTAEHTRAVYMEACEARMAKRPEQWLCAIRTDRYKYVRGLYNRGLPVELYDLQQDPDERHNLAEGLPEVVATMDARLDALTNEAGHPQVTTEAYSADEMEEVEGRLRDLGYLD